MTDELTIKKERVLAAAASIPLTWPRKSDRP